LHELRGHTEALDRIPRICYNYLCISIIGIDQKGNTVSLQDQIRKGSTEILILKLLTEEPMYGYQISQELHRRSGGYFEMKEGLIYPTLHRMAQGGLLKSEWRAAGTARRRKYYAITEKGQQALSEQITEWDTFIKKLLQLLDVPAGAKTRG
jgi:PadR family transcriptional regulator PadR